MNEILLPVAFPHLISLHFLWETPSPFSHRRHLLNELRTVYNGAWKSLFSFYSEVNIQMLEMEQRCSEEHTLPKTKLTVSFPPSSGASPPATVPSSFTYSIHSSTNMYWTRLYKFIGVDICPQGTPSGMGRSPIDRQPQYNVSVKKKVLRTYQREAHGSGFEGRGPESFLGSF